MLYVDRSTPTASFWLDRALTCCVPIHLQHLISFVQLSKSLSDDNQATKFTGVLTLLEAMLSTEKLRVQQEVNIKKFEVDNMGGGPRVVVSTAAFHARIRGSVPGLGSLKVTKMFLPHPRVKLSIVGSLRDGEVACSAADRQGSDLESCVWRTVSSQLSHHSQEVLLAQFSLYVHKGGLISVDNIYCQLKEIMDF